MFATLSIVELLILTAIGAAVALALRPDWRRQVLHQLAVFPRPWALVVAATLGLLVLVAPFPGVYMALGAVAALLVLAWLRQFAFLMQLPDDAFPGRNDKLIWALLLIVLPPLGTLAFWSYRQAHWPEPKKADASAAHELG